MDRFPKLLAIDDDPIWLEQIPMIFEDECEVVCAKSIDEGLSVLDSQFFDIILLDLNFDGDDRTGLDVFRKISATDNSADVIVISGETRPDRLVQIMNAGITQFIPKPSSSDRIRNAVRDVIRKRETRFRAFNLAATSAQGKGSVHLIGSSPAMIKLKEEIAFVVSSGAKDILLIGETGTGKEVVARTIASMADPARRFVPIHCGAISDGLAESELFGHVKGAFTGADKERASAFEVVGGGFVFLDEIGEMPLNQQAKLLRVLQERKVQRVGSCEERPVSFRCISATNANLTKAIDEKKFREDLFYRVAKYQIKIPSLKERDEDIPELIHYFLSLNVGKATRGITDEALALLESYSWPGNVRQLQSIVEIMASRCIDGLIREKDVCQVIPEFAAHFTDGRVKTFLGKKGAALIMAEKKQFQIALMQARGNKGEAARLLDISRATFYRRVKELGITTPYKQRINENRVEN